MTKNVLITGVSGFVGTNLADHLSSVSNFIIYGHSRKPATHQAFSRKINFVTDYSGDQLNVLKIDTLIHLAGIAHDLSNQYTTEDYYRVNFEGTKKAVDIFLQSGAQKFIFVSSIKALCDKSSLPAHEGMTPVPKTDYGKSKLKAEEYILSKSEREEKKFYILRPAMIHGPGNKGNLNLLYRFAKNKLPFPFGLYSNKRSFHSIENFNSIVQKIIETDIASGIYHVADDGFLSTTELHQLICEAIGNKAHVLNLPKGFIEIIARMTGKMSMVQKLTEDMMVSNQKIKSAIGAELPLSLKEGLTQTIQSFDGK